MEGSERERERDELGGGNGIVGASLEKMAELRETWKRIGGGRNERERETNPPGHMSSPYWVVLKLSKITNLPPKILKFQNHPQI